MSLVVFASPPLPPPPPPPSKWTHYTHMWIGCDGQAWDLSKRSSSGVYLERVTGAHFPEYTAFTADSPAVDGQELTGGRVPARPVEWDLFMRATSSDELIDLDRRFWAGMRPDQYGTWKIIDPKGRAMSLKCRLEPDGRTEFDHDSALFGWQSYPGTGLIADAPYWEGEEKPFSWIAETPQDFIDPDGSPPFHIGHSSTVSTATVTNEGNVPGWLRWKFTGPFTAVTATVSGGTFTTPEVPDGSVLIVETDPKLQTAFLDDEDVSGQIVPWDPRPIPPGTEIPVTLEMTGTGLAEAFLTPRFYRGM